MRVLIALALALAVIAGVVFLIVEVAKALGSSSSPAPAEGPMQSGIVQKVAFGLLWLLVAGLSTGLIGSL